MDPLHRSCAQSSGPRHGPARRPLESELRRLHIASLSNLENLDLNFREARAINDLDRDLAWRMFVERWRRSRRHDDGGALGGDDAGKDRS